MPARQEQYRVTASVDGQALGVFQSKSGGGGTSEETKTKEGGMTPEVALGGSQSIENVTVSRLYRADRDGAIYHWLYSRRGKGAAVVSQQSLDDDGNPFGPPHVWSGVLMSVSSPEHDAESSDKSTFELEISTNGSLG